VIFSRVASEIRGLPRRAKLTVFFETPAAFATAAIVGCVVMTIR
jgi:hypothetical protein